MTQESVLDNYGFIDNAQEVFTTCAHEANLYIAYLQCRLSPSAIATPALSLT